MGVVLVGEGIVVDQEARNCIFQSISGSLFGRVLRHGMAGVEPNVRDERDGDPWIRGQGSLLTTLTNKPNDIPPFPFICNLI